MKNNEDSFSPDCETAKNLKHSEKIRDIRKVEIIRKEIYQSRREALIKVPKSDVKIFIYLGKKSEV